VEIFLLLAPVTILTLMVCTPAALAQDIGDYEGDMYDRMAGYAEDEALQDAFRYFANQNFGVDCRQPTLPPTAEKATPTPTRHNAEKATPLRGLAKHYEQLSATGAGLPLVVFACL
jgi:hypothetical protein